MTNLDLSIQKDLRDCLKDDSHWEALRLYIQEKGMFHLSALASVDPRDAVAVADHQASLRMCNVLEEGLSEFRPKKYQSG